MQSEQDETSGSRSFGGFASLAVVLLLLVWLVI